MEEMDKGMGRLMGGKGTTKQGEPLRERWGRAKEHRKREVGRGDLTTCLPIRITFCSISPLLTLAPPSLCITSAGMLLWSTNHVPLMLGVVSTRKSSAHMFAKSK